MNEARGLLTLHLSYYTENKTTFKEDSQADYENQETGEELMVHELWGLTAVLL